MKTLAALLAEASLRSRPYLVAVGWFAAAAVAGYSTAPPVLYFIR